MPYRCPWCGGWRYDNEQKRFFPLAGLGLALGLGALASSSWYHHHHYNHYYPWYY